MDRKKFSLKDLIFHGVATSALSRTRQINVTKVTKTTQIQSLLYRRPDRIKHDGAVFARQSRIYDPAVKIGETLSSQQRCHLNGMQRLQPEFLELTRFPARVIANTHSLLRQLRRRVTQPIPLSGFCIRSDVPGQKPVQLIRKCLTVALAECRGSPVSTPLLRRPSMKLRIVSRSWIVSLV